MRNYLQNGHIVRVTTPAGGIASGDALIVGSIFGIAAYSSAESDPVELATTGVFQLPKASAAVLTVGARVRGTTRRKKSPPRRRGGFPSAPRSRRPGTASPASRYGWMAWQRRQRDDQSACSPSRNAMSVISRRRAR